MMYEWPESLRDVYWCMNQVNAWITSCRRGTFNKFNSKNYRKAGASDSNWCFLHALQAACFGLDRADLVTRELWSKFWLSKGNDFTEGVGGTDVDAFLNFLRAKRVSLVTLFKNLQKKLLSSTAVLERRARTLDPGHYIVYAAEHSIEHYLTLVVTDPVMIYDDYNVDKDPPCLLEPLQKLDWLTHSYEIRLVALPRPTRSKKSKKGSNEKSRN
ncbi:LOW QUALITY PROTEIN: hypothetical protein PHMEG_0009846 [Phytophthora megakarya]|uniref:Cysteine protease n=1 Tax=Phytophthora megakarya TaxID=4795 RepID=A0A225WF70_9STRA|nr:LOW QUALITY PROTEIN: hypothetical protein PHMEG_0009846 [Phytophthora megakarya]